MAMELESRNSSERFASRLSVATICLTVITAVGCATVDHEGTGQTTRPDQAAGTRQPSSIYGLQTEVALTAAWVTTLTPQSFASAQAPLATDPPFIGVPLKDLRGPCPESEGQVVQQRQRFCVSVPATWLINNVDGGLAAYLGTTPGQAISLQPNWAATAVECHLLIFTANANTATERLAPRHEEFASRPDVLSLSDIGPMMLGNIGVLGFTWEETGAKRGGLYAGMVDASTVAVISEGGSNCQPDQLLPILGTLRFN